MAGLNAHAATRVFLVGAGPGDPRLITLRGAELLARADVVLYDYLANPLLLEHASPRAVRICLGRHGRESLLDQDEVNRLLIEHARAGRMVVRLKGGDPAVFARLADEVAALTAEGIPFEIVPGITAALAAGSHAGIPLTDRHRASAVALVTGHEQPDKQPPAIDYAALARFPGTLVFYMGVTSAPAWTQALIDAGLGADTPAAIIRRCTWPDQLTIRCSLGEVAATLQQRRLRPPVIVVVGHVVQREPDYDWFAARPLAGTRVLITRPQEQSGALAEPLRELGADVWYQPAIRIEPPEDFAPLDSALDRLAEFQWVVFSSANGVRYLVERLLARGGDLRQLAPVQIAAIGPGTADELARYHLKADLVPKAFRAEALAADLVAQHAARVEAGQHCTRLLLVRASRGREALAEQLSAAGATVEQVVAYRSSDVQRLDDHVAAALDAGQIDWVTVTSSAIARSLVRLAGPRLHHCRLVSISPITSATLAELGYPPAAEARQYTMTGVVQAILAAG